MAIFSKVSEKDVTKAIVSEFADEFLEYVERDVIIVGAGPSGLIAAKRLADKGVKVILVESNNYLGGGFWIGGYLMNKLTIREPGQRILDEIGVPYKKVQEGLYVADGPHACSKLIGAAMDAGAKVINMTKFDDVVMRKNRVGGVVINWTPVSALPRAITCVDPVAIESKMIVDATGHDAVVIKSLEQRGLVKVAGFEGMWVEKSEDDIVDKTSEVYPGVFVTGMAVATTYGSTRMGPTFGGMLLSGEKVAELIIDQLKSNNSTKSEIRTINEAK
ncbi:MAG: sulfide-dependent adenosine diphosphate thiazole synthase [Methanobacterium sp.]|nr:sulfide-dependent adenosine diphosphate thiazole synthase [Methanobacterium sp.]